MALMDTGGNTRLAQAHTTMDRVLTGMILPCYHGYDISSIYKRSQNYRRCKDATVCEPTKGSTPFFNGAKRISNWNHLMMHMLNCETLLH